MYKVFNATGSDWKEQCDSGIRLLKRGSDDVVIVCGNEALKYIVESSAQIFSSQSGILARFSFNTDATLIIEDARGASEIHVDAIIADYECDEEESEEEEYDEEEDEEEEDEED